MKRALPASVGSPHPDLGQSRHQLGRQINICCPLRQISRRVFTFEISPALKWPLGCCFCTVHLRVQNDPTAPDAIGTNNLIKPDDFLSRQHNALDDPVDRPGFQQFIFALGPHSCDMPRQTIITLCLRRRLPVNQSLHGFRAHTELDKMKRVIHRVVPRPHSIW